MMLRLETGLQAYKAYDAQLSQAHFVPLQQSWGYGALMEALGVTVTRCIIYDDARAIGLAQLVRRRIWRVLPLSLCLRGPLWLQQPLEDTTKAAAYRLLKQRGYYNLFMPEQPDMRALNTANRQCIMTGYHTVMLDLTQTLESLRAAMDGKWRNRLKAAEASGLAIRRLKQPDAYRFLLEAETRQRHQARYTGLDPALIPAWQGQLGPASLLALAIIQQHQPIAGMIALIHHGCATYQLGWSNAEGKAVNAHNLLLWRMMKELKAQGIRWLDLGGVDTHTSPGIARFKLGSGGRVHSLPGTFF